jgi:hypothetical protein
MSGFTGKTETISGVPKDVQPVRSGFSDWLLSQGFGGLETGAPDLQPYRDLFTQQNALNLAQAKEASGNLTGSGYANQLGKTAARANVEQGAFLANLLEQSKQANANRFAQLLSGFVNSGVGPDQQVYKPGFLDYAAGGATALAGGGAFNKLF